MSGVLLPLFAGAGMYAAYCALSQRNKQIEAETLKEFRPKDEHTHPKDAFTAWVQPSDAVWDVNTEEYTLNTLDQGITMDGRVRKDILSGHGRAPVGSVY